MTTDDACPFHVFSDFDHVWMNLTLKPATTAGSSLTSHLAPRTSHTSAASLDVTHA